MVKINMQSVVFVEDGWLYLLLITGVLHLFRQVSIQKDMSSSSLVKLGFNTLQNSNLEQEDIFKMRGQTKINLKKTQTCARRDLQYKIREPDSSPATLYWRLRSMLPLPLYPTITNQALRKAPSSPHLCSFQVPRSPPWGHSCCTASSGLLYPEP